MAGKEFITNVIIGGKVNSSFKSAFGQIGKQTDKSTKNIDKLSKSLGSFEKKLVGLATGYIATRAFTSIAGTAIEAASSMEQYRITLNTVLKDSQKAGETLKWASQFANVTPFETDEVVQATVRLESYGLTATKYLPIIGDMAAVMGKDVMQATEAIADAQTGELERLKEFGITKEMIISQANKKLAGIEVVNNKGQIVNQRAFNAALLSLMKERYDGGMEQQSKSFKGRISTIVGTWKSGLSQIAGMSDSGEIVKGSAFDSISQKAGQIASTMEKMQADGSLQKIQQNLGIIVGKIMDGIDRAMPKIVNITDYIAQNGDKIISTGLKIVKAYVGFRGATFIGKLGKDAVGTTKGILKAGKVAGKFIKDNKVNMKWQYLLTKQSIGNGVSKGASVVGKTVSGIGNGFKAVAPVAKGAFGLVGKAIMFMTSPMGLVVAAIAGVIAVGVLLYKNWDKIKEKMGVICGAIGEAFKGVANSIIGAINWATGGLNNIKVTIPDWVPEWLGGGKTFGFNIPPIPMFARGGIANQPSIFGEAGPEMAIPLKRGNPRSISLLNKTANLLGLGNQQQGMTFVYSPTINSNNIPEIKQILEDEYEKFKKFMSQYVNEEGRVSYEPNVLPI